jgi:nucleotide-binding universal stress UspA family protein
MRVLLAIDGSPHSDAAVATVAGLQCPERTVEILTVVHPALPLLPDPAFVLAAIYVDAVHDLRERARILLDTAREQIERGAPNQNVATKILEGNPKDVIVEEARQWGADLIVLGSHGHSRVRHMLLGSVASGVLAKAPCSVYVVRTKDATHSAESLRQTVGSV